MSYSCSKVGDPRPGHPYKGGNFCAFLPENMEGVKIANLLKRAFECGLTFQIKSFNGEERVTWGPIPHKTSWDGGKARYGPAHPKLLGVVVGFLAMGGGEPGAPAQQILSGMALPPSHSGRVGASLCFSLQGSCGMADQPWHSPAGAKPLAHPTSISGVETCNSPWTRTVGPVHFQPVLGTSCPCRLQDTPGAELPLSAPLKGWGKNKGLLPTVVLAHQDLQCCFSAPQEWLPRCPVPP